MVALYGKHLGHITFYLREVSVGVHVMENGR